MARFEEEYRKLNSEQKKAVDTINGPVLVIAGPGTGKTQLLSMRVANIMRVSDVDASNILCLTFTNKAAVNMRDRLLSLAGPESNKVTVKTFHGFAAEIMNTYPDYFWSGARLGTAPDAVQLEIVQSILSKLPLSNPLSLRFAGQFTATDDALKALRLAKEAGLTPSKLRSILNANIAFIDVLEPQLAEILSSTLSAKKLDDLRSKIYELPEQGIDASVVPLLSLSTVIRESLDFAIKQDEGTGKTKNVGKWKSRWIQTVEGNKAMADERRRNEWWMAFADVYEKYRQQLHEHGYYDYSDMLLEVITQLERQPDLSASVQERFQYVLIDEFQDSNAAQLRLAHLVADHHTAEGLPNIMAVGDDDQSIFGFNGAELNNMLYFDRNYGKVERIVLTENYRSSQTLLNAAEKIISQAEDRLVNRIPGLSKHLVAKNEPSEKGTIGHLSYPAREHQLSAIARLIQEQHGSSKDSIAVLARGHESLRTLAGILLRLDVPVRYEQQSNVLEYDIVRQILLIAEALDAIRSGDKSMANEKIAAIVRHPMWGIKASALWELATSNFSNPDWLSSLRDSDDINQKQIGNWLMWLSREVGQLPLPRTIEHIIGLTAGQHMTSPIRAHYLEQDSISAEYLHSLSAVRLLQSMVNEFSAANEPSLSDFVHFIQLNNENGRGVTDESVFVSSGRPVELYTVHKAKGLEFDRVFIIDAIDDNWKPRVAGRKPPANLPLQPPGEKPDDYVRLLYVAVTRARHSLTVSSHRFDQNGKELLASPYIKSALPEKELQGSGIPAIEVLEENLAWPRLEITDEKTLLHSRLENYELSATHLLDFLDLVHGGPHYFMEKHLLGLPEAQTQAQAYGNAMHAAMQLAQKQANQDNFELSKIHEWYDRSLKLAHLPAGEYEKYSLHGRETLTKLFEEFGYKVPKGGQAEQYLSGIRAGNTVLKGFLDRIDQQGSTIIISDYKTGTPLHSFSTRDQTKAAKAWRHRSQLIFYALMLRNHPKYSKSGAIDAQMVYLEAETAKDLVKTYTPSNDELERMQSLADAVWSKILNLDFPDTSKYPPDATGILEFEDDLISNN